VSEHAALAASPRGDAASASPRARKYRGAVIGLGGVARGSHIPGFMFDEATRSRLEIVATVDDSPSVLPLDGVPQLVSRDDLRLIEDVDFVDICTPTSSHLDLTIWALEHGYHVLCEKPVALTRAEARRIADASRESGRVVMPCHQYRYNPVWVQLRADAGGGILLDHGTHLIYELLDVAGVPPRVRAWTGLLRHRDYDVEDSAHLLFEYPERLGIMFLTWAARHRESHVRFIGDTGSIDWIGGVLRLEREGDVESFDLSAQLDKSAYPAWFAGLFNAFANAMDANDLEPSLLDIGNVAAVLEAAYEAARTGVAQVIGTE
jgi:predicted dehydrogenase